MVLAGGSHVLAGQISEVDAPHLNSSGGGILVCAMDLHADDKNLRPFTTNQSIQHIKQFKSLS